MASQFTAPILIGDGDRSQPLERVSLSAGQSDADYDEGWLEKQLYMLCCWQHNM